MVHPTEWALGWLSFDSQIKPVQPMTTPGLYFDQSDAQYFR